VEYRIRFMPSRRVVKLLAGESLLAAARRADLPLASSCGAKGECARCGLRVLEGATRLAPETERERRAKSRNRIDPALRLACHVHPKGDLTVTSAYW